MGHPAAGRVRARSVTGGGGDTTRPPTATGGEANHALTVGELATHSHTNSLTDPGHNHIETVASAAGASSGNIIGTANLSTTTNNTSYTTTSNTTVISITNANAGSGTAHNTMAPFMLGTWYMKLSTMGREACAWLQGVMCRDDPA